MKNNRNSQNRLFKTAANFLARRGEALSRSLARRGEALSRSLARRSTLAVILIFGCLGSAAASTTEPATETAGKPQLVKPGEVPQGLDKTAWNKINAQIKDAEMIFQPDENGGLSAQNSGKELKMRARKKGFDVSFRDMPGLNLNAVALEDSTGTTSLQEIGRASCRERV